MGHFKNEYKVFFILESKNQNNLNFFYPFLNQTDPNVLKLLDQNVKFLNYDSCYPKINFNQESRVYSKEGVYLITFISLGLIISLSLGLGLILFYSFDEDGSFRYNFDM